MNVLFHVDQSSAWPIAVTNVRNMLSYAEQENTVIHIEIVANDEAVRELRCDDADAAELAGQLQKLAARGVKVIACANSMWSHGIHEEVLLAFVDIVPSGVVEIAVRQQYGFAYIKP